MTTPDELQRAVERLSLAPGRMEPRTGFYTSMVRLDDLQLLLSERAELLATVERMREIMSRLVALPVATRELVYLDKGIGTKTPDGVWLDARAALTTGEANHKDKP